jgi:hypothetical protein
VKLELSGGHVTTWCSRTEESIEYEWTFNDARHALYCNRMSPKPPLICKRCAEAIRKVLDEGSEA